VRAGQRKISHRRETRHLTAGRPTRPILIGFLLAIAVGASAQTADLLCDRLSYRVPADQTGAINGPLPVNSEFTVTARIRNDGSRRADSFRLGFYLSKDSYMDPHADLFLGSTIVSSIEARSSKTVQKRLRLPTSLSKAYFGRVLVGVAVDYANQIPESNESNNRNRGSGQDRRTIQLYDPQVPSGQLPISFANRSTAIRWLQNNRFEGVVAWDYGWSRPLSVATFSRFNGRIMPAAAFRIQATDPSTAPYQITLFGSDPSFDPASLTPDIGEPSPRTALSYGAIWTSYVQDYHNRF